MTNLNNLAADALCERHDSNCRLLNERLPQRELRCLSCIVHNKFVVCLLGGHCVVCMGKCRGEIRGWCECATSKLDFGAR